MNNSSGKVDEFYPSWLNNTLPGWNNNNGEGETCESRLERHCYLYNQSWANVDECRLGGNIDDDTQLERCDQWVYDTSTFQSTIITEVNEI